MRLGRRRLDSAWVGGGGAAWKRTNVQGLHQGSELRNNWLLLCSLCSYILLGSHGISPRYRHQNYFLASVKETEARVLKCVCAGTSRKVSLSEQVAGDLKG